MRLSQRPHKPLKPTVVTAQRTDHRHRLLVDPRRLDRLLGSRTKHRMRTDFDQAIHPVLRHRPDGRLEPHRLTQVAEPVLGVHLSGVE